MSQNFFKKKIFTIKKKKNTLQSIIIPQSWSESTHQKSLAKLHIFIALHTFAHFHVFVYQPQTHSSITVPKKVRKKKHPTKKEAQKPKQRESLRRRTTTTSRGKRSKKKPRELAIFKVTITTRKKNKTIHVGKVKTDDRKWCTADGWVCGWALFGGWEIFWSRMKETWGIWRVL